MDHHILRLMEAVYESFDIDRDLLMRIISTGIHNNQRKLKI